MWGLNSRAGPMVFTLLYPSGQGSHTLQHERAQVFPGLMTSECTWNGP